MAEKIVRVRFVWSENNRVPKEGLVFEDSDAEKQAEDLLLKIGWDNRNRPCYDKTQLEVYFESGIIYTGRWDVKDPQDNKNSDIKIRSHIRQTAQWFVNKPGNKDWNKLLEVVGEGD